LPSDTLRARSFGDGVPDGVAVLGETDGLCEGEAPLGDPSRAGGVPVPHTSAYVSIRQHTSGIRACVRAKRRWGRPREPAAGL
jgi:hypothetical protein